MQWNVALDIGASGARMAVRGRGVAFPAAPRLRRARARRSPFRWATKPSPFGGARAGACRWVFRWTPARWRTRRRCAWFSYLLRRVGAAGLANRPRVLIARPPSASGAALKALVAYCMEAGAAGCSLIRSDLMAAVGAGCDPTLPEAVLVGEMGAGSMTVTLFSLGRAVETRTLPWGMRRVDEAIRAVLRGEYALEIGPRTAEDLKLSVLSALGATTLEVDVRGVDLTACLPRTRKVEAAKLQAAVKPVAEDFCRLIESVVRLAPSELAADLAGGAIALTGGGARLPGLDRLVAEATGLSVRLPEDPAGCVVRGLAAALEAPARYQAFAEASATLMKS